MKNDIVFFALKAFAHAYIYIYVFQMDKLNFYTVYTLQEGKVENSVCSTIM